MRVHRLTPPGLYIGPDLIPSLNEREVFANHLFNECNLMARCGVFVGLMVVLIFDVRAAEEKNQPNLGKLPPPASGTVDFQADVRPILVRSCLACHGLTKQSGGLRLDQGAESSKGSNSGPVFKAGDSKNSRLIHLVAGTDPDLKMPPNGELLTADEVGKLRAWIDAGAKYPAGSIVAAAIDPKAGHW